MKLFAKMRLALSGLVLATAAGCATDRQTDPPQTATEQLLVTNAVDQAVERLKLVFPPDSKLFLDQQFYDADNGVRPKYAVAAVREQLLRLGAHLVDDRKSADVVVELRAGAESIDYHTFLIGIPSFPVPIPLTGVLQFPELAFFKIDRQTGVAKLALTAYTPKDGALLSASGLQYGQAYRKKVVVLLVGWTSSEPALPDPTSQP
jgi:hypothetical protein